MSALTQERDWMRKCAKYASDSDERELWTRMADEIDAYLEPTVVVDLFGETTVEPIHEPETTHRHPPADLAHGDQ